MHLDINLFFIKHIEHLFDKHYATNINYSEMIIQGLVGQMD